MTGTMTPAPAGSPAPRAPTPWTRHGMTQAQFMQLSREKRWELMTPDEREGAERLRAEKEADTA